MGKVRKAFCEKKCSALMLGWGPKSERKASDKPGENSALWQIEVREEDIFSLWHAILKMCSVLPFNGCSLHSCGMWDVAIYGSWCRGSGENACSICTHALSRE